MAQMDIVTMEAKDGVEVMVGVEAVADAMEEVRGVEVTAVEGVVEVVEVVVRISMVEVGLPTLKVLPPLLFVHTQNVHYCMLRSKKILPIMIKSSLLINLPDETVLGVMNYRSSFVAHFVKGQLTRGR